MIRRVQLNIIRIYHVYCEYLVCKYNILNGIKNVSIVKSKDINPLLHEEIIPICIISHYYFFSFFKEQKWNKLYFTFTFCKRFELLSSDVIFNLSWNINKKYFVVNNYLKSLASTQIAFQV